MSRLQGLAVGCALAVVVASPLSAAEAGLAKEFNEICVRTDAAFGPSASTAKAKGFAGEELLSPDGTRILTMTRTGSSRRLIILENTKDEKQRLATCILSGKDPEGVEAKAFEALFDVARQEGEEMPSFVYTVIDSKRLKVDVKDQAARDTAMLDAGIWLAAITRTETVNFNFIHLSSRP